MKRKYNRKEAMLKIMKERAVATTTLLGLIKNIIGCVFDPLKLMYFMRTRHDCGKIFKSPRSIAETIGEITNN